MVLRKLPRNPALDGVDLFRRLDAGKSSGGLHLSQRLDDTFDDLKEVVRRTLSTPSSVRGWRAQALFASLVAALDECVLMTFTDTGDVYFDGDSLKPTDYLIVLRNGRRLAVDVKDSGIEDAEDLERRIKLSRSERSRMERYAELIGAELHIAIYSPLLPTWLLLPIANFSVTANGVSWTTVSDAIVHNEMGLLGDLAIGLVPPLTLRLLMDTAVDSTVGPDGKVNFQIGGVEIGTGDGVVHGDAEKRLLWFLLLYGGWEVDEAAEVEDGRVVSLEWTAAPPVIDDPSDPDQAQEFRVLGWLSGLYSRLFEGRTRNDLGVATGLDVDVEPGMLVSLLPHDFESEELRLWRFTMRPSHPTDLS